MDAYGFYLLSGSLSCLFALILNAILVVLIYKKSSKEMKAYCQVLLQNCVLDIFVAAVFGFTLLHIEFNSGRIFVRTGFPGFPTDGIFPCLAAWLFVAAFTTEIWSMFIQTLFRYCLIVRNFTLSERKTWFIQISVFFVALINGLTYLILPCRNFDIQDNLPVAMTDLWKNYPDVVHEFRSINVFHPYFIAFVIICVILTVASMLSFFILVLKVRLTLKSATRYFSPQTLKIHKQFGKKMILQAIPPMMALSTVSICLIVVYALPTEITKTRGGFLLYGIMPMHWIPVFNPLITLLTIRNYRRVFLFCNKKWVNLGGGITPKVSAKTQVAIQ